MPIKLQGRVMISITSALLPAFVFALAGIAKIQDPYLAAKFMTKGLGFEFGTSMWIATLVGYAELALAAWLAGTVAYLKLPSFVSLAVLALFVGLLIRVSLSGPNAATCGCFGSLFGETLQRSLWTQVWIDAGLILVVLTHLHTTYPGQRRSACVPQALVE